jgi:hypothetical protein
MVSPACWLSFTVTQRIFHMLLLLASLSASPVSAGGLLLFDADEGLAPWRHVTFTGSTDYAPVIVDGQAAIRARGQNGASMLAREVNPPPSHCTGLRFRWRVDVLQPGADIASKEREDVAAALYIRFAGSLLKPGPVLRYVWSNQVYPPESIVDSPYLPGRERSIVVAAGNHGLGAWVTVQRDLAADFKRAFGPGPMPDIDGVALFTDNDQTGEAVLAYYGWARLLCP